MTTDWFHFDFAPAMATDVQKELRKYAAFRTSRRGTRLSTGINSAWMAEAILKQLGHTVTKVHTPKWLGVSFGSIGLIPGMKVEVSGFAERWPDYLLPWQKQLLLQYSARPGVHAWWPPGAGKTLGGLVWSMVDPGPVIYVTRSGARRTIAADVKRFTNERYFILAGEKPQPLPPKEECRFIITGWDTLVHHARYLAQWGATSAVFDEIHRAKSHKRRVAIPRLKDDGNYVIKADGMVQNDFELQNNMTAAAEIVSRSVKRRFGSTGSAIKDRLRDLWSQLDLVEPEQWGYFYDWARRYCNAHEGAFGGVDTRGRSTDDYIKELQQRLSLSVFQVPYAITHANLPPKRRQVTYIPREQLLKDEGSEARRAIANAGAHGQMAMAHARLAAAACIKRNAITAAVEDAIGSNDSKGKIVVVTGLRGEAEKLHAAIRKKLPDRVATWWGTGDHTVNQRDEIQAQYMDHPGPCVLVGTMQAWGESLNLQDTDVSFAGMLPFTPGEVEQYEGRFSRQGQRRPCLIHYLVAEGTYDEHVAQLLIDKLPSVEKIVGGGGLEGFRTAVGGIEDADALINAMLGKLLSTDYEIDEDNR